MSNKPIFICGPVNPPYNLEELKRFEEEYRLSILKSWGIDRTKGDLNVNGRRISKKKAKE